MVEGIRLIWAFCAFIAVGSANRCPNTWVEVDGHCFFVSTRVLKFDEAELSCNDREARLAVMADDRSFNVMGVIVNGNKENYWIGLNKEETAGPEGWKWIDGSDPSPDESKWFQETIPGDEFSCAQYRWNEPSIQAQNCLNERKYICKRHINVIDTCDYENDWHPFAKMCFKYFTSDASWNDAQATCTAARGELAILDTNEKLNVFTEVVNCKPLESAIWMGLSDQGYTSQALHWVNGQSLTSPTNWDEENNQPVFFEGDNNCVAAVSARSYMWRVDQCGDMNKFVCEKQEGVCADGWNGFIDISYCYLIISDPTQFLTWIESKNRCNAYGGTLIDAKTDRDQDLIKGISDMIIDTGTDRFRLGVSDIISDGDFRWEDGSNLAYNNWEDDQPGNVADRMDCGYVNGNSDQATWRTSYCFLPTAYVCQIPIHTAPNDIVDPPVYQCEPEWQNFGTECYWFSDDSAPYETARAQCKDMSERANLLIINSAEEQAFVIGGLKGSSFIGLVYKNGDWEWEDTGEKAGFKNWDENGKDNQDLCVRMSEQDGIKDGAWISENCNTARHYICKMGAEGVETGPTEAPTLPWSPYCGSGWSYDPTGHHCYKLRYDELVSWETAMGRCREEDGADIVSITSLAEQAFINSLIHNTIGGAELYWIGLNDRDQTKGWQWTDNSAVGFFFWNTGEPNNWAGEEWCVEIAPKWNDRWNDHTCSSLRGYICEKDSTRITPTIGATPSPEPPNCDAGGIPLVSGEHYIQNEYIRSYYYADNKGTRIGISEPKRDPWNARLDNTGTGSTDATCPNHETDGVEVDNMYVYAEKDVVDVTNWDYALVEVMACDEVHVAFADGRDIVNSNVYEWIVGGWENSRVAIRKCVHPCEEYVYTNTPTLLDCDEYRIFWFTWKDGEIMMGRGRSPNADRIYRWVDPDTPIDVKFMGLTTAWTRTGKWCVPQEFPVGAAGCWTPFPTDQPQELELFLFSKYAVISVTTQGAPDKAEWVTKYRVSYRIDETSFWQYVKKEDGSEHFDGNVDQNGKVVNTFPQPVMALYLRIRPSEYNNKPSLRIEVNGCSYLDDACPFEEPLAVWLVNDRITSNGFRENYEPYKGRIESPSGWIAASPSTADQDYIQATFDRYTDIHSIFTRGHGEEAYWVTRYKFSYSRTCWVYETYMEPYGTEKIFDGNSDQGTIVERSLKAPMRAMCVRIYPTAWNGEIGMRLEFKTTMCPAGCSPQALIDGDNHKIEDFALTATSSWAGAIHGPHSSRLHLPSSSLHAGAWCAGDQIPEQDWIQADLGYTIRIYGVATQGRGNPSQLQYVTSYFLSHSSSASSDSFSEYRVDGVRKVFEGNFDRNIVRKHYLSNWFTAHRVRLHPLTWEAHMALRWELYGCPGGYYSRQEVGCYADVQTDRDLPEAYVRDPPGGMTRDLCSGHCFSLGYSYAGAQWGRECFCGNSYGRYGPSSSCDYKCSGTTSTGSSNTCGGRLANTILTTGLAASFTRCADNYMEYNNRCWRFETEESATWSDARINCKKEGGDLAVVRDQNEMDFINGQLPLCCEDKWLWIGLHSLSNTYWFEWATGEAMTYTNWARREPNGFGSEEDCVHIYPYDGTWNDESCDVFRFNYICQKAKETLPTVEPTEPDSTCPQGWYAYRWKCFTMSSNKKAWTDKQSDCAAMGGTLARIEDSAEQAFIQSTLAGQEGHFWTDLNERDSKGTFLYSNGQEPSYTHWASNKPGAVEGSSCVTARADDFGLWYNELCEEVYTAICEIPRDGWTRATTIPTVPSGGCTSGWSMYGNDCYLVQDRTPNQYRTFDDALMDCQSMSSDLVSIHSEDENMFVYEKIGIRASSFWTGGSRNSEGGFQWSDQTVFSFNKWDSEQPEEDQSKSCIYMSNDNGMWSLSQCSAHLNWICKIPRGVIPQTTVTVAPPSAGPPGSCSPDSDRWKFFENKCYFFSGTSDSPDDPPAMNWYDAENYCKQNGGHLTAIHNENTNAFIMGQVQSINTFDMWIGLNEIGNGGFSWWSDGTAANYFNWADGSPDDNNGQMCVSMIGQYSATGDWRNQHCSDNFHFVCAKDKGGTTVVTQEPTIRPGGCPDGFLMFENKCFRFYDEQLDWSTAQSRCQAIGSTYNLAAVSNVWEQSFLTEQSMNSNTDYWIGMTMLESTKEFVWVDNTPVEYVNWAPGEPNGGDSEQCAELWVGQYFAGKWNDAACQSSNGYICQTLRDTALPTPSIPSNGRCSELPDGDRWVLWNDDCYKLMSDMDRSWQEAEDRCVQDGAHLASILSPYENGFIHAYMGWLHDEFHRTWNLWIGLSDKENPGRYTWSDTWSPVYINWGPDQPDITTGGCAQMEFLHGGWEDYACDYQMWSVCKHSLKDPTFTKPPASGGCPMGGQGDDWVDYGDNCFLFKAEKKNFAEARMECHYRSSELASIHSDDENEFVRYHTSSTDQFNSWWWIGLYRTDQGGFVWADDTGSQFFNWNEGEPSNDDGENCVEFYTFNGKWNDVQCQPGNGYICKYRKASGSDQPTNPPSLGSTQVTQPSILPSGTSGTPPTNGPSTDRPDGLPPVGGDSSGMSAGGVVGLVFFLLFLCLAAIIVVLFVMRRQGRPIPILDKPTDGPGMDNPVYASAVQSNMNGNSEA